MRVTNILWDLDPLSESLAEHFEGEDNSISSQYFTLEERALFYGLLDLPYEVEVDIENEDDISDYLSETYGWCVFSYDLK